jgi:predicted nucleic acid-binding protein
MVTPSPVRRGLIDTAILADYRDGHPDAMQLIADLRLLGFPDMSQISVLALFARCIDPREISGIQVFLKVSKVHSVTAHTMRRAQQILESLPPPCGLTPDDAIMAATAIEQSLPLYTLDPARFVAVSGLTTIRPY